MSSREIFPGITADPETLGGEAVIKGTRIPVSLILGHLASGMSIDEIAYEYDLTRKEIYAALAYAAKRIGEEAIHAN
ncbi:MAG TPA: DUF433 domain-containing protein [Ktedonobacteraceae bacterium]|jgi:uncharacterized protein (DUF433 family)|nr:DUF433 domain-containing protein [Ktedonobacteraceae bacterium]